MSWNRLGGSVLNAVRALSATSCPHCPFPGADTLDLEIGHFYTSNVPTKTFYLSMDPAPRSCQDLDSPVLDEPG